MNRRCNIFVAAIALAGPACGKVANLATVASYQALVEQDLRLATVGYRLASSNAPFCLKRARQPGWVLHDINQYPDATAVRAAFDFGAPVSVAALVPGGPAEQAGIKVGDGLHARNGTGWNWAMPKPKHPAWERLEAVQTELAELLRGEEPLGLQLVAAAGGKSVTLSPAAVCASDFWVDPKSKLDAGADGERVRVTSALVAYVADDDELAVIAAHEMAHNLLDHRARIDASNKGKTAIIRDTEIEADRLSVWLMVNAGYDPEAAIRFWQRYGPKIDVGIFSSPTHLRWKNRIAIFREEISKVVEAPITGKVRVPPLLAAQ